VSQRRRRPRPPRTLDVRADGDEAARRFFFDLESPRRSHRGEALARQVQEAVSLALAASTQDPRLDGAFVVGAEAGAGGGVLVVVALGPAADGPALEDARAALLEMKPFLRSEVAHEIHRKRVPDLSFRVVADLGEEG